MGKKTVSSRREQTRNTVLAGLFITLLIVMTIIPYTGYISVVPAAISITTLHIPVIIGAILLGWKYGTLLGGVWGVTCLVKAFVEPIPANVPFQNPVVSVLPRLVVGLVAALVFSLCRNRFRWNAAVSCVVAAICATLTNTVLVLSALFAFGSLGTSEIASLFGTIVQTLVGINGLIEMAVAALLTPLVYAAVSRVRKT